MNIGDLLAVVFGKRVADEIELHNEMKAVSKDLEQRNAENQRQLDYLRSGQYGRDLKAEWQAAEDRAAELWRRFPENLQVYPEGMMGPPPDGWPEDKPRSRSGDSYSRGYAFLALLADGDYRSWVAGMEGEGDPRETHECFALATDWAHALRDADAATLELVLRADKAATPWDDNDFDVYCERLGVGEFDRAVHLVCQRRTVRPPHETRQSSIESRLRQLDDLVAQGVVTPEEHARRRAEIISEV